MKLPNEDIVPHWFNEICSPSIYGKTVLLLYDALPGYVTH